MRNVFERIINGIDAVLAVCAAWMGVLLFVTILLSADIPLWAKIVMITLVVVAFVAGASKRD